MSFPLLFRIFITKFCCLFLFISCVRPSDNNLGVETFVQGTADNIEKIERFKNFDSILSSGPSDLKQSLDKAFLDGKILKIKTTSQGELVPFSTSRQRAQLGSELSFADQQYILNYEIFSEETEKKDQKLLKNLLGKVKFKGSPNQVYYIVPQLKGNYLIFYKVAETAKIPYDERPVGIKLDDQMMATPLVGYRVEYCTKEQQKNIHDEKTGQFRPKCTAISNKTARYVRLFTNKVVFSYLDKKNVFPANFFSGNWFFAKTLITSAKGYAGEQLPVRASLVNFRKVAGGLEALDASSDIRKEDKKAAIFIPGSWEDYEESRDSRDQWSAFSDRKTSTKEVIERSYFRINFDQLSELRHSFEDRRLEFENLVIDNDYLSLTFENRVDEGVNRIKLAFRKVPSHSNYVEKKWFEIDSTTFFPIFHTSRTVYLDSMDHTELDKTKFYRSVRFNPNVEVIEWYFSKQTPKDERIRGFARTAVHYFNSVFELLASEGNKKITIKLNESQDQELGDIRYNIINMMVANYQKGQISRLGYGPNINNPQTGEVISGTANVWISNLTNNYINLVRQYIRFRVYPTAWLWPGSSGVSDFFEKSIEVKCPEVISFIDETKGQHSHAFDLEPLHPNMAPLNDKVVVKECGYKLAEAGIIRTIIHEMFHSAGLRHVFSASVDSDNYYKSYDEITKIFGKNADKMMINKFFSEPPKFSSLMDYVHEGYPILTVPGKYDIAAIRFLYFNKIELVDGRFLEVSDGADADPQQPQKSIEETIADKNVTVRHYKVCGGTYYRDGSDVTKNGNICIKGDYGATPLEIAQMAILSDKNAIEITRRRYDRSRTAQVTNFFGLYAIQYLYKLWQEDYLNPLLRSEGRKVHDYSPFDEESVTSFKDLLLEEARNNSDFKQYYEIREPIFDFFKEIFFLPIKYCIYRKADGFYQSVDFEKIVDQVIWPASDVEELLIDRDFSEHISLYQNRKILVDCESSLAKKWAEENNMGELFTEVGYLNRERSYFLPQTEEDSIDELSPISDSFKYAYFPFGLRIFAPLLLAEPDFYSEIHNRMEEYILLGMDLNPYLDEDLGVTMPRTLSFQNNRPQRRMGFSYLLAINFRRILGASPQFVQKLKNDNTNTLFFHVVNIVSLGEIIDTIVKRHRSYEYRLPIVQTLYEEFMNQYSEKNFETVVEGELSPEEKRRDEEAKIADAFLKFFISNPIVLYDEVRNRIAIPASKDSLIAIRIMKYNENNKCFEAEEEARVPCSDKEEKKAQNDLIFQMIFERTKPEIPLGS